MPRSNTSEPIWIIRPMSARFHLRERGLHEQHGALDEELELIEAGSPGEFLEFEHRLGAGGVDDEDIDRAEFGFDGGDHLLDLIFIAHVGLERRGPACRPCSDRRRGLRLSRETRNN